MHFGELSLEGGIAKTTKNLIEKKSRVKLTKYFNV